MSGERKRPEREVCDQCGKPIARLRDYASEMDLCHRYSNKDGVCSEAEDAEAARPKGGDR